MTNEIQLASTHFPQGVIPTQILKFYEFLTDNDKPSGFLDLETLSDGKDFLKDLLNEHVIDEFIVFYVDNAHACYSIWLNGTSENIEMLPIMYNNTEGTYLICASNFNEFIFLLSKNLIDQLAFQWKYYLRAIRQQKSEPSPIETFTDERIIEADEWNKEDYEDYELFANYVKDVMKISYDENPVMMMGRAIENHPDMVTYIRSKNGFIIDPGN